MTPFPLRAGRLVRAGFGTPFLPTLASSQQKSSLLLTINFPVGKNVLGLPSERILLLASRLLPHTQINRVSAGLLKMFQHRFALGAADLLTFQPTLLPLPRHCRGERLLWGTRLPCFICYTPINMFGKDFFLFSYYSAK